jgi:hypothetical protein
LCIDLYSFVFISESGIAGSHNGSIFSFDEPLYIYP